MAISLRIVGTGFLVSIAASYLFSRYRGRWAVLDLPNKRSLHNTPLPRLGGVGIVAGILISAMMTYQLSGMQQISALPMLGGFAIVIGISMLDDIYQVHVLLRLTAHFAAAILMVYGGLFVSSLVITGWSIHLSVVVGIVFSILFIVWMTNLYNFMDGMDGLAAGMGVIGFGTFAILGWLASAWPFTQISASIAAACGGFLCLNYPPAKIFMGDLGAASLGFLAAVLMLWASHHNIFPLWVGVAVFSPFIVDATWTLAHRIMRGRKPWEAHREHVYQRLILVGWSHRKTLFWECVLMAICSAAALMMVNNGRRAVEWCICGSLAVMYGALIVAINFVESQRDTRNAPQ